MAARLTEQSNGDGLIEVAPTGLTVEPSAGVGVKVDTDGDGLGDTVFDAAVTVGADGSVDFSLNLADMLV